MWFLYSFVIYNFILWSTSTYTMASKPGGHRCKSVYIHVCMYIHTAYIIIMYVCTIHNAVCMYICIYMYILLTSEQVSVVIE